MKALKMNIPVILLIIYELFMCVILLNNPEEFTTTALVCQGVLIIVLGILKMYQFMEISKRDGSTAVYKMIGSALAMVLGLLIILNPFTREGAQAQFTSVAMMAEAVIDFFLLIESVRSKNEQQ